MRGIQTHNFSGDRYGLKFRNAFVNETAFMINNFIVESKDNVFFLQIKVHL
jgi:hypothetical protein